MYLDQQIDNGVLGKYALGRTHNHLLLEDLMITKAPVKTILLIHQDHPFVSGKNSTWWSRLVITIGNHLTKDRLNYVVFQKNLFWALNITIVANAEIVSVTNKQYTEKDIKSGCTQQGGWGLRVETATGDQNNILFHQLIQNPIHLQLWTEERTTDYRKLKEKLRTYSNNISLAAVVKRLTKESYGDSVLTIDICHRYSTIMSNCTDNTKDKVLSKSKVSSQMIKFQYSLPGSDKKFIQYREYINSECLKAIQSSYGHFNTITDPLLSQTKVSHFR